jgi:glutathione synthase/RimK-type ligase-like ATP-grasp enzyme
MKIAIHYSRHSFCERWTAYCEKNLIDYKLVNCYSSDIVQQLTDCDALMWHHYQTNPKSILFAKQLLFALEQSGKKVFPDFRTAWHFDDKLGQKYLLEAIGAPLVPSYVFYDKKEAIEWIQNSDFPKVFKLRGGAGSSNVRLIKTKDQALKVVSHAFGRGFKKYNSWSNLKEIWRKLQLGHASIIDLFKGLAHCFYSPRFSVVMGREKGYVYFQDFIPAKDHDIRIIVIDNRAFAIKRLVRKNDFRASGSGNILYEKEHFNENTIKLAFELAEKLKVQCVAFDFVYENNLSKLLEISYGFVPQGYDRCPGYWDKSLNWIPDKFDPYGWMIESLLRELNG